MLEIKEKCGFNYVKDVDVEDLVPKLIILHIGIDLYETTKKLFFSFSSLFYLSHLKEICAMFITAKLKFKN